MSEDTLVVKLMPKIFTQPFSDRANGFFEGT